MKSISSLFIFVFCLLLATTACLTACSGIPMRSIPRLMSLQNEVLILNPAEFKFALQTDSQLTMLEDGEPKLELSIKPKRKGGFEPYSMMLPLRFETSDTPANLLIAGKGRRWIVYSLRPESQAELRLFQKRVKNLIAEKSTNGGGSLVAGIHQKGLAPDDPRFGNTQWDSWLQTDSKRGYFNLWSGTIKELKATASKSSN